MILFSTYELFYANTYSDLKKNLNENHYEEAKEFQSKADVLAKRMGLPKIPQVFVHAQYHWKAIGSGLFPLRKGRIAVNSQIKDPAINDFHLKDSHTFIIAHELAHIKHRDMVQSQRRVVVLAAIEIGMLPLAICVTPLVFIVAMAVLDIGLFVIYCLTVRGDEKRADLVACQYTTDREKLEFIVWFQLALANGLALKAQSDWWERLESNLCYDDQGNDRLAFMHPSMTNRIAYIKETMNKKPVGFEARAYLASKKNYHILKDVLMGVSALVSSAAVTIFIILKEQGIVSYQTLRIAALAIGTLEGVRLGYSCKKAIEKELRYFKPLS